jgi:uncharacterized membrane protein YfcA
MNWSGIILGVLLFPAVLIGNYLGAKAFGKVSDTVWRTFVLIVLGVTAMVALLPLLSG